MRISSSYTIVLRGNEAKKRLEWAFVCQRGIQVNYFFILGLNTLIEQELHIENKMAGGVKYSAACRVPMGKYPSDASGWVKVTLPRQRSLMEIQGALSKALSSWLWQGVLSSKEKSESTVFLTLQERRVTHYLREGFSQTHTSFIMGLSVKTINAHKQSLMRKLGLKNNREFQYWLLGGSEGFWG
ncbi:helix-turn-helix transcriptional regulator [Serratia marcescens]|uniref:helix-turn-helix transcriptional regulator n=1 Tax=Serratia marcescens TaxID=615 RepID=UPI00339C1BE8